MELYDEELADFLESFGILKLEIPSGESKDCIDIISKTRKRGTDDFIGLNKVHREVTSSGCFFGSSRCYMYR